jgi:hypothetical protein
MLEAKPVDLLDKEREPVVSGGPDPILCESHRSVQDSRIAVQDIRGKPHRNSEHQTGDKAFWRTLPRVWFVELAALGAVRESSRLMQPQ